MHQVLILLPSKLLLMRPHFENIERKIALGTVGLLHFAHFETMQASGFVLGLNANSDFVERVD